MPEAFFKVLYLSWASFSAAFATSSVDSASVFSVAVYEARDARRKEEPDRHHHQPTHHDARALEAHGAWLEIGSGQRAALMLAKERIQRERADLADWRLEQVMHERTERRFAASDEPALFCSAARVCWACSRLV